MKTSISVVLLFFTSVAAADARGQTALERELAGEMVSIPGGTFRMGDLSGEGHEYEQPVRTVTVPTFRLGRHEVTNAQWGACVADGGCEHLRYGDILFIPVDDQPVVNVLWSDAMRFIGWLNSKTGGNRLAQDE